MDNEPPRTFEVIVWIGERPGVRVQVVARDLEEAAASLKKEFGADAVVSVWNEQDAESSREATNVPDVENNRTCR